MARMDERQIAREASRKELLTAKVDADRRALEARQSAERWLRIAFSVFALQSLGRFAVAGRLRGAGSEARMRQTPEDADGRNWGKLEEEFQRAICRKNQAWLRWDLPLRVVVFWAKLQRRRIFRNAACIVASFLEDFCSHRNRKLALKLLLLRVIRVQRAVRAYFMKQETKRILVADMLRRLEVKLLKRQWSEADLTIISRESKRLRQTHVAKERKRCERAIKMARQSVRRYMRPKSAEDYEFIKLMMNRHCLPSWLLAACSQHTEGTRRRLIGRILDERCRKRRAYAVELKFWEDIEQAVQLMHALNTAEKPSQPIFRRLPFLVEVHLLQRIVSRLRQWHSEHLDEVSACAGGSRIPFEVDEQVRALVNEVVSPAFLAIEEAARA